MTSRGRYVSTGHLPSPRQVQAAVDEAYRMYRSETGGENSQTYPALARVPGGLFGICVAGTSGSIYRAGDTGHKFTIMSVAKPFVFALVCGARGRRGQTGARGECDRVPVRLGGRRRTQRRRPIESDGERRGPRRGEPGAGRQQRGEVAVLRERLSAFDGRDLALSDEVYASASAVNHRNRAIADFLASRGRIYSDPDEAVDLYTRQSCL